MLSIYGLTARDNSTTSKYASDNASQKKRSTASNVSTTQKEDGFANPNDFITYIIPDFNAVKYFQKDFVSNNEFYLMEETEVNGFEVYLVEQWVINRSIGTVVTIYTGNEQSKIVALKFTIVKKPMKYYPLRFQEYLNELIQNHAKMKSVDKVEKVPKPRPSETRSSSANELLTIAHISNHPPPPPSSSSSQQQQQQKKEKSADFTNEVCFVTNLASLPSNLNLLPVPDGDVRKLEAPFMVNYDLKKLQCTGRSVSLTSDKITDANEGKFRQMYKIYNVKIPIKFAVREIVNVVQTCLFYFDLLDGRYCTGLLCVKTEQAIINWWNLIGLPHFNAKPDPKNGILPPRTVAAMISLILSVRLRLLMLGVSDVPKDPFDFESFLIAIGLFQRQYKLTKSRKLDMETLNKLFTITNAKLMPEKESNYFYSSLYGSGDGDGNGEYEAQSAPPPSSGNSTTPPSKRMYGKMELKKMAHGLKNTVQDHINVSSNRDPDEQPTGKQTGGRIRNKIAKLADNITPPEVENLDLGELVRHYIIGKTLTRLFRGVEGNALAIDEGNARLRMNESSSKRGKSIGDGGEAHLYSFESLRNKIAQNHDLQVNPDNSKYALGLSRRFGLQNKRSFTDLNTSFSFLDVPNFDHKQSLQSSSIVDSFLQLGQENNISCAESLGTSSQIEFDNPPKKTQSRQLSEPAKLTRYLNRRNSWPFLVTKDEINLNACVQFKSEEVINLEFVSSCKARPRSASTSVIQEPTPSQVSHNSSLRTLYKFSRDYLANVHKLMQYENLRGFYFENTEQDHVSNATVSKSFQLLNMDLMKLKNLRLQVTAAKRRIMEEGSVEYLGYNLGTLSTNVDRLSYEIRIVSKKIKEMEENFKIYEKKFEDDCQAKMKRMIDQVLKSNDFRQVYQDPETRNLIAFKLTGDKDYIQYTESNEQMSLVRWIVVYFYDIFMTIFSFFKFERTNMDLERIRNSWIKLDPSRSIIKKAYSYLGRDPSRDSVAAAET
ncbi:uncharacterized protein LODBEIA_P23860 [Lodderomyces beijingensis]|uniref:STB6-like N-terminal domain-containing protein n=1 Tax=Lodderomyces beijingensis TaxID=1775926 RepID=A0ABP0ZPQ2_9ASCO